MSSHMYIKVVNRIQDIAIHEHGLGIRSMYIHSQTFIMLNKKEATLTVDSCATDC